VRAVVFGYDGETALGRLPIQAWEDTFLKTFQITNRPPEPGVTCR